MNFKDKYTHLNGKLITKNKFRTLKKKNENVPKLKNWSKDFVYIYGLYSSMLNKYFYVGVSHNPRVRFYNHLLAKSNNSDKDTHIELLKSMGLKPKMILLAQVPIEDGLIWERAYIKHIKAIGYPLTNRDKKFSTKDLFNFSDEDI
jgi:hypothetical protein